LIDGEKKTDFGFFHITSALDTIRETNSVHYIIGTTRSVSSKISKASPLLSLKGQSSEFFASDFSQMGSTQASYSVSEGFLDLFSNEEIFRIFFIFD
jgi:hypothetical protein